ncbi:Tlr 6Fp protein [Tupanvirus soda lake]|uniref:Tlr 6Fp protein n=2 Tax=Tupanvirus TaxID=2094720 RepID=A0A6N1NX72_9VIRU|nr:Tlr 6Fp protein [Tupanvirus soda lake]QKU35838.1 Tlr 6Fp protein [Tupanvirus soda lake]
MTYHIYPSNRRDKKFFVYDGRRKIYFGAKGYEDYTIHKDIRRKQRYNSRHRVRENWRDPKTAGFWSKWILWNKPSLQQSVVDTKKRFGIDIVMH